ncbi:MAG: hypothetical protein B6D55_07235 [Candidatus Omnitrophica bacterium 4484_70.2]|nr:MAG: hypothetical protein B6D55_07235 [Candidatus Omnitrophica bacterium 4484_70.2]
MRYFDLERLKDKLFFTVEDVAENFNIKVASSRILCYRYAKKGIFIRLKKDFYILAYKWENLGWEDFFILSNYLQVPSYISFMTALSFYEVSTQIQRNFFENASLKRSLSFNVKGVVFNFYKLKRDYYFDFLKKENFFIATKEKAFVDSVYLYSLGRYRLDFSSLDLDKLDKKRIKNILKKFPQRTKNIVKEICKI